MHRRTQEALAQVAQAEWFRAVGQPDVEGVSLLSSWDAAIASCSATGWQNVLIEAANRYTDHLRQRSRERFREWNRLVREMKTVTVPLVERKIEPVVRKHDLPKVFADTVHWDMLHLAMEGEYADVYPPGFFASQAYWYIQGHFPCGWQGCFPEGKLVVY